MLIAVYDMPINPFTDSKYLRQVLSLLPGKEALQVQQVWGLQGPHPS